MTPEVGKRYTLARGRTAEIVHRYVSGGQARYVAIIDGRKSPEWYCASGLFRGRDKTAEDAALKIVSEYHAPITAWAVHSGTPDVRLFLNRVSAHKFAAEADGRRVIELQEVRK